MFKNAFGFFTNIHCHVGGGTNNLKNKLYGSGCLVSEGIVISALHIYERIQEEYDFGIILKNDGLFRAEPILIFKESDIIILKCIEKLKVQNLGEVNEYPPIEYPKPFIGTSVGYIGNLQINNERLKSKQATFFTQAFISSMIYSNEDSIFCALSGGVIQKGFSGGAVFTVDCKLIGIMTKRLSVFSHPDEMSGAKYELPIMVPLFQFQDKINEII